jgi:APA family basic amino acid/polyamine antiporter
MLVMGCIIGAGIFRTPSVVVAGAGGGPAALGAWVLGGILALCGALVFAELACLLPRTGGQYVFLREAFGRFPAFCFGWLLLAGINSPAIAFVARVFVDHARTLSGVSLDVRGERLACIALIAGLTLLNVRGLRLGVFVQNLAMSAKLFGLAVVLALGPLACARGIPAATAPGGVSGAASWSGFGAALLAVVFSYGGWQNVTAVASEVRDPARTLPRSILLGTVAVVVLYLAFNASLLRVLGAEGLAASATPAASAAGALLPYGAQFVSVLVMVSTLAITQALLMVTPRIYYAMSLDGVFLRSASWVHPRYGTPAVAIGLQGAFAVIHLLAGESLDLLQATVVVDWFFFSMCGLALFVFRRKRPDAERAYRAHGYPWLPGLFLLGSVAIFVNALVSAERLALVRTFFELAAGGLAYTFWRREGLRGERSPNW